MPNDIPSDVETTATGLLDKVATMLNDAVDAVQDMAAGDDEEAIEDEDMAEAIDEDDLDGEDADADGAETEAV
jgi:hypothetical protein